MKKVVVLSIGILLCASITFGQAGYIGLFSDPNYINCHLEDTPYGGLKFVYVVHKATAGATASQWMLVNNGMLCSYLAESSPFITIGTAFTGISVAYGECLQSDIVLLAIQYFCNGLSPTCATITVVPDPAAPTGTIEVVDCEYNKLVGYGDWMAVNNDGSCECMELISVEEATWGQVKALYR